MGSPQRESIDHMARSAKRLRQTAAGIVRQALLDIEAREPLPKYAERLVWADRQALETAFAALTAPTPPTEQEKRDREALRSLDEELDFHD